MSAFEDWLNLLPEHGWIDESNLRLAFNAGMTRAAEICQDDYCGSQGFAGPTCCILPKRHTGIHKYGYPRVKTAEECRDEIITARDGG